jgi:hypothetical protein
MATKDFKVRNGLIVGQDDFTIDVSNDTAVFSSGYTVNIGTNRLLKQNDNVSELTNDADYIDLTALSGGTGVTYNSTTGEIEIGQSVATTDDVTFNEITASSKLVLDTLESAGTTVSVNDNLTVSGNFTVTGTETELQSDLVSLYGNLLVLNSNTTGVPGQSAEIQVERGDNENVSVRWNETTDRWQFSNDGTNFFNLATEISDLTNDSEYITLEDLSGTGDITYNNTTGEISFNNSTGFITDPGVSDLSGTVDEIDIDQSTGSVKIGLPNNVVIQGNLTVKGTTTTIESNTLSVGDNLIVLNNDVTGSPTENAGIEIERGTEFNVFVRYNESTDRWQFTNDGFTFIDLPTQVSDLINDADYASTLQEVADNGNVSTTAIQIDNIRLEDNTVSNQGSNTDLSLQAQTEVIKIEGGGALALPVGNDTDRPQGEIGMIRYNSLSAEIEIFNGTSWVSIVENIDVATIGDVEDLSFEAALIFG